MRKLSALFLMLLLFHFSNTAQVLDLEETEAMIPAPIQPNQKFELGIHSGYFFTNGNIDPNSGFGLGLHLRKSLDYVFSLRLEGQYGQANGEDRGNTRSFTNDYFTGSLQILASLNNLKWEAGERRTNFYALAGLGLSTFEVRLEENDTKTTFKEDIAPHVDLGLGIAFRISKKINVGIEHKFCTLLNKNADLIDGVLTIENSDRNTIRDVLNYTSLRINFNIGKGEEEDEPHYWMNPMDAILKDMEALKEGQIDLTDTDEDGVIDVLDQEAFSSRGAIVNTKGKTVDSDKDGYPDHRDREPYSPLGYKINKRGVSQTPDIQEEVKRYVAEELKNYTPPTNEPAASIETNLQENPPLTNWYLPTIYFSSGRNTISSKDFGTLAGIANLMKANPDLKLVVTGHTDEVSDDFLNNELSYKRAINVINYLVRSHKIDRSRLLLQWKGEKENLVKGNNLVNRRVEFRVAMVEDVEMDAPK